MLNKKIIFSALLICSALSIFATDPDTNYIQTFRNIFALKTFVVQNGFTYTITPRNNPSYSIQQLNDAQVLYNPYIPPTVGVSLNIKGIGLSYVFKIKDDFWDTTGLVKSSFKQVNINIYKVKFGIEGYYQDYRRFYFHYKGDEVLLKNYNSDIRAYQWGVNAIFIPNGKKFSYNAAFNQTAFQKKSAGSFLMMLSFKFNEIKSDYLLPDSVKNYFLGFQYNRNRNYGVLFHPGYGFNLTKKNFYFSGALFVGVGLQWQTYRFINDSEVKLAVPVSGRAKAGLGYNGKVFYTGVFANADVSQTRVQPIKTQQMLYSYGAYVGFRFVVFTKTKGQLKQEEKRKRLAEKNAKKAAAEAEKKRKKDEKEAKKKKKK